jgi:hypothetical protein
MMGDVRALPGHPIAVPDGKPNEEIVMKLERLLERAKSGEILALGMCTYNRTDNISVYVAPGAYGFHLVAAIKALSYKYDKIMDGD